MTREKNSVVVVVVAVWLPLAGTGGGGGRLLLATLLPLSCPSLLPSCSVAGVGAVSTTGCSRVQ